MTSVTQFVGRDTGHAAAVVGFGVHGRGRTGGSGEAEAAPSPVGRESRPSTGIVRLPGQEPAGETAPGRSLVTGGAFTLAVAIGLALDQSSRPEELEPATPTSAAAATEEAGDRPEAVGDEALTEEEQELVEELRARDAEVRRHEAAHAAAGGQHAGSPTYTYQTGPDGRQYAVGGEVSIDTTPVKGDPEATLRKAQQIKAAATAPADPSSQDRRVAARAEAMAQQARAELAAADREERQAGEAGPAAAGGGFAQGAFSAAAASYRGPAQSSRLVSIAV